MNQLLDDLFRRTSGQIVATLTRILGARNLALAEEVAQDALIKALQIWPLEGVPANPSAWLIQVAKHRAVDLLRREQWLADRAPMLSALDAVAQAPHQNARLRGEPSLPDDDQLAMMFLACHPILTREARVALTLKTVCGFGIAEIARALLSRDEAIAQRLVRAKRQLRDADVRFELDPHEYLARLDSVLDAVYLLFNEGYGAHAGDDLIRRELCDEAIRLALVLVQHAATSTPAVHALLALMLLQAGRLPARVGASSDLLRLAEQDRTLWDRDMIARGLAHLNRSADGDTLTPYHVEAGIAATHATADSYATTDWRAHRRVVRRAARNQPDAGRRAESGDRDLAIARTEGRPGRGERDCENRRVARLLPAAGDARRAVSGMRRRRGGRRALFARRSPAVVQILSGGFSSGGLQNFRT